MNYRLIGDERCGGEGFETCITLSVVLPRAVPFTTVFFFYQFFLQHALLAQFATCNTAISGFAKSFAIEDTNSKAY